MRHLMPSIIAAALTVIGVTASDPAGQAAEGYAPHLVPDTLRPAVQRAEAGIAALQGSLLRRLQEATKDGPAVALDVCRVEAGAIRDRVETEQALLVGRTSHALRNPNNAPPAWAVALVKAGAGRRAQDFQQRVFDLGAAVGVIRPIPMGMLCASCHGPAESLSADVRAVLQHAYPSDRATGFTEGDLRGWIWAEVRKDVRD